MPQPSLNCSLLSTLCFSLFAAGVCAGSDHHTVDDELRTVLIDTSADESFLAIRADTRGRLFVGGREALFVYEPDPAGLYGPRQEIYRFPPDSWIYDIEIRGNDVYAMTNRALYLLPDAVTRRSGIESRRLIWGHPEFHPHQCLHGVAWGPDGYLYMSMGDLLVWYGDFNRPDHWGHWTFRCGPKQRAVPFTGVGGFLRCQPDGSDLQVVARGTRNSCGLVFDDRWNLFSHDNDHEGLPTEFVPGRLLHVTPRADFGWPRGWLVSKTPDRFDLLRTMNGQLGRAVPVGQTYYKEDLLPAKYRHNLLLARWGIRCVTRYPLEPRGASFAADEHVLLQCSDRARPVGVAVGRGGRIFVTIAHMAHNERSPVYKSDLLMLTTRDDAAHSPFDGYEATTASNGYLWSELASRSSWRSRRAFIELMRRGNASTRPAIKKAKRSLEQGDLQTCGNLLWLAARTVSNGEEDVSTLVRRLAGQLADHTDANLRHQSVRILSEFYSAHPQTRQILVRALADPNSQVQHAAVVGLLDTTGPLPRELLHRQAVSDDSYLRQAATQHIAAKATVDQLVEICTSERVKVRLAGVLAAGIRLTVPPAVGKIDRELPLEPWPDEKVYSLRYDRETVDVRSLGRIGMFTVAEHWRARAPTAEQEALFRLLLNRLTDSAEPVRLQAAYYLSLLNDRRAEAGIAKVRSASARKRLAGARVTEIDTVWTVGPFDDLAAGFATIHPPQRGPVDLGAIFQTVSRQLRWERYQQDPYFNFLERFGPANGTSRYLYFRIHSSRRQQILFLPGSDDGLQVWCNGKRVYDIDAVRAALPMQDDIYLTLQAGSNDVLLRVRNVTGEHMVYLHYRAPADVTWEVPERIETESLGERLRAAAKSGDTVDPALLDHDWTTAVAEGDAERGRHLFSADGIGCAKCHAVDQVTAPTGGPSLAAAGNRFSTAYLVESILLPSKQIAPQFQGTSIAMTDGRVLTGLVVAETANQLSILTPDAKRLEIDKREIETREPLAQSTMPAGLVNDPVELRDLLRYLSELKQ